MKRLLPFLLLAGCAATPVPSSLPCPPVYHATLKNGVRVVLCPEGQAPCVSLKLSFRVSFRDEPPGRAGLAPSALTAVVRFGEGTWLHAVEARGGWCDPTNFAPEVFSQDIFLHTGDLDVGIAAIREMLQGTDPEHAASGGSLSQVKEMYPILHVSIPRPVDMLDRAGFAESFSGEPTAASGDLTQAELRAFLTRHFVPARAQVTVVGAFPPAGTLRALAKALEDLPNPPGYQPEPAQFSGFTPGLKVVDDSARRVRIAYPVPPEVPTVEAMVLAGLLQSHLRGLESCGACEASVDARPGQRLLRIEVPGDAVALLPILEARLAGFPASPTQESVRAAAEALWRQLASNGGGSGGMRTAYWISWKVAFESDPLGWAGHSPWEELDRLSRMDLQRLKALAAGILVPERQLAVASAPEGELAALTPRTGDPLRWTPLPFRDAPPPDQDPPCRQTFRDPSVRALDGGRVLFLEVADACWYTVHGYYPRGIFERGTRAYAAALEAAPPGAEFKARGDHLAFDLPSPCWTPGELEARLEEIQSWLRTPPAASAGGAPVPALNHACPGPAPSWILMVCGPHPVPALEALRLPGEPPSAPRPVAFSLPEESLRLPDAAPFDLIVPLVETDAESRAAARLLACWLDPQTRAKKTYGPFTLQLPTLVRPPQAVSRCKAGNAAHLVLRFQQGERREILEWAASGAKTVKLLREDSPVMENLKGHALSLREGFAKEDWRAMMVDAVAWQDGGGDPDWADRMDAALRAMTAAGFVEIVTPWLKAARVAGVPK